MPYADTRVVRQPVASPQLARMKSARTGQFIILSLPVPRGIRRRQCAPIGLKYRQAVRLPTGVRAYKCPFLIISSPRCDGLPLSSRHHRVDCTRGRLWRKRLCGGAVGHECVAHHTDHKRRHHLSHGDNYVAQRVGAQEGHTAAGQGRLAGPTEATRSTGRWRRRLRQACAPPRTAC